MPCKWSGECYVSHATLVHGGIIDCDRCLQPPEGTSGVCECVHLSVTSGEDWHTMASTSLDKNRTR